MSKNACSLLSPTGCICGLCGGQQLSTITNHFFLFWVNNYRQLPTIVFRYSLDNGSIMARWNGTESSATRSHGLTAPRSLRRRVPPIFPTKTLLASFVGVPGWQTNKNKRSKRHLRDQRAAAFFDILKLPLRGGSLPNRKW